MQNRTIKIGLFGAGKFGSFHAKNLAETNFELAGIYDPIPEKAANLAEIYQVGKYDEISELMAVCDAVLIASTTTSHFSLIKAAISQSKHIFVEKPIVADYMQMMELNELAIHYPKVIQIGHLERFNLMLQDGFESPEKPWMINAVRISPFNLRVSDVSVIHDLMIHDIDIALTIAGTEIADVRACGNSMVSGSTDVCHATLTFRNGMVANLSAGRIFMNPCREMDFFYRDRHEHFDFQSRTTSINYFQKGEILPAAKDAEMIHSWPGAEKAQSMWHINKNYPENNAILSELKEFYESIANNKPVRVGIHDAGKVMHTIALIEDAMNKTNQTRNLA